VLACKRLSVIPQDPHVNYASNMDPADTPRDDVLRIATPDGVAVIPDGVAVTPDGVVVIPDGVAVIRAVSLSSRGVSAGSIPL
jgi:hypothetical protein